MRTQQNREDEKKIAEWLGWTDVEQSHGDDSQYQGYKPTNGETPWNWSVLPCWTTCDADAVALLPELVKRGYHISLENQGEHFTEWGFFLHTESHESEPKYHVKPTISEAITAVLLEEI